ncbi:hypothetical protein EMCRGX_G025908 [Ephydatia muelleri]
MDQLKELLEKKWEEIDRSAIELLQRLIRTDTQNFVDEGTEMEAVRILQKVFDEAGVSYKVIESRPGRGNIVARIKGKDAGQGALLLNAHLDTVRAPKTNWREEGWKHDPFAAEIDEEDGCLYGRGAVDMKHMVAMSVTIMCYVAGLGIELSRDLVFAGVADEERSDSAWGAKYLVKNHPDLVEADIVLSELGGISLHLDAKEVFPVQIAEKGSAALRITAHGPGGHGSVVHKDNPVSLVGGIAHKLATTRLPLRVNDANKATIEGLASTLPYHKSLFFRWLLSPSVSSYLLSMLPEEQSRTLGAILSNIATPTAIGGGEQFNQVPTTAWLHVDGRTLPGCTSVELIEDIKHLVGPELFDSKPDAGGHTTTPAVTIEVLRERPSYCEDLDNPTCRHALDVMRRVIAARAEGAPIVPNLLPGATDLVQYSEHPHKKPVCIGFSPIRFPKGLNMSALFHGVNERIPVEGFKWGLRVLFDVVLELCSAKAASLVTK